MHWKSRILIVFLGSKGLKAAGSGSTFRQRTIVRAGGAICFSCPHSSQPFIIQRALSNYQCTFNYAKDSIATQVADLHVCWITVLYSSNAVHTCAGTDIPYLSRGRSPWSWPPVLPSLTLALFHSVHGVRKIEQAARNMLCRYLTVMSSHGPS